MLITVSRVNCPPTRRVHSFKMGPLLAINGVITPHEWPQINGYLGLFHPCKSGYDYSYLELCWFVDLILPFHHHNCAFLRWK